MILHPLTIGGAPPRSSNLFGASRDGTRPAECGAGHCGLDFFGPVGTPVRAVLAGTVNYRDDNPAGAEGKMVRLHHEGGTLRSDYIHLDTILVSKGQQVAAGQQIGTVGLTGIQNSAPHLHFAMARLGSGKWTYIDPLPTISGSSGSILGLVVLAAGLYLAFFRGR